MQSSLKGFFTAKPKEPKEPKESKEKKEDVTPSNVPAAAATASSAPTKKQTPLSTKQTPLFAKQPAAAVSSTSKPTGKRGAPVEVPSDSAPSNKKQTPTRDHSDVPMADIHTTPAARRPAPPSSCAAADSSTGKHVAAALSQASTAPKRPSPSILASPPPAPSSAGSATPAAAGDSRQLSHSFIKEKRDAKGRKLGDAGYDPTTLKIVRPSKGFTPAMEQYWEIKSSHADMLLFFKMGKFYEMFEEDALIGHRELDLAFMGKEAPHVGFPEAVITKYAEKLVALGYKVGVVEQMETPADLAARNAKLPKGVKKDKCVRREICQVFTKGTAQQPAMADATYLLAVTEDLERGMLGVCYVDCATGHFHLGQCEEADSKERLQTLITQLRPAEVILHQSKTSVEAQRHLRRAVAPGLLTPLSAEHFWDAKRTRQELARGGYFDGGEGGEGGEGGDDAWPSVVREAAAMSPPLAFSALGGCVSYLRRLLLDQQLLQLAHIDVWTPTDGGKSEVGARTLVLDGKTLANLELFENSSDQGPRGTLFSVVDHTQTPFGKRRLRQWLCAPPRQIVEISERQDAVAAVVGTPELPKELKPVLRRLPDLERLLARVHSFTVARAANAATHYEDVGKARLNEFIKTLEGFETLRKGIARVQPLLAQLREQAPQLAAQLDEKAAFPAIETLLADFRASFDIEGAKQCGRVVPREGKDPVYEEAKQTLREIESKLEAELKHWQKELGDKSIVYWTPGGSTTTEPYQLQVSTATLKKRGTPDEFMQKSSKQGTIRFWTAEIEDLVAEHIQAKLANEAALKECATRLFAAFSAHFTLWRGAVSCAAELDCILSLAEVSARDGMCRPTFVEAPRAFLHLSQGVNMCVQAALADRDTTRPVIPNDIIMGTDPEAEPEPAFLLVTGPNMGGKSTLLRQACLTVLMAHLGCWVHAESCRLSAFDRIFTRVGANDAIMAGLSTFKVELTETASILEHATHHSLVILDELGRGTATFDGMAIAHGVMQHLVHEVKCLCLFATHYHTLTREFERPNPLVALYHMACQVDESNRNVTFLYRFLRGACNRSHGIHVARLAGLPEKLLEHAEESSAKLEKVMEDKYTLSLARRMLSLDPDNLDLEEVKILQAECAASLRPRN